LREFRVDERERQRARRERRRACELGTAAPCHAPASVPKAAELMEKVLDTWDGAVARSRAGLQRRFAAILRQSNALWGQVRRPAT
jgi:hypothetical protein